VPSPHEVPVVTPAAPCATRHEASVPDLTIQHKV
jgi:hypothetical protein